jgi:hypothetical protein
LSYTPRNIRYDKLLKDVHTDYLTRTGPLIKGKGNYSADLYEVHRCRQPKVAPDFHSLDYFSEKFVLSVNICEYLWTFYFTIPSAE